MLLSSQTKDWGIDMGEKDISEKILFDYNDVFADVVNVLLFEGNK